MASQPELRLTAFYRAPRPAMRIVPAARWRDWMSATTLRYANRCLPMLVANEHGWWLLNEQAFTATWSGGDHHGELVVDYGGEAAPEGRAVSLFGYGILTFEIPFLFRTSPGWDLLARGPANLVKDGVQALEGLVETDWSVSTFTMNWKLTRPGTVSFDADEPVCMLVPVRRGELERCAPQLSDVQEDPDTEAGWDAFGRARDELAKRKFLAEFVPGMEADRDAWQGEYFRGVRPAGSEPVEGHKTKVRLRPFE